MSKINQHIANTVASGKREEIVEVLQRRFTQWSGRLDLTELDLDELGEWLLDFADGLRALDLRRSKLSALPDFLPQLTELEELNITGNKALVDFPDIVFSCPRLNKVIGLKGYGRGKPKEDLELFLRRTTALSTNPELRRQLFFGVMRAEDLDAVSTSMLIASLRGDFPELRERASTILARRSARADLGTKSKVAVLGNVSFKKTALKKALADQNITYAPKFTSDVTHLVLGTSPKVPEGIDDATFTLLTEEEAIAIFDKEASPAPLQAAATEDENLASAQAENIDRLLLSDDDASVGMAVALLKSGGLFEGIETGLFVAAKLARDAKHRAFVRKLVKRHGSPALQKVVADRGKIAYTGDKAERNTCDALTSLARMCADVDWIRVSLFVKKQTGFGLSYALGNTERPVILEILRERISKKGHLDFHGQISPGYQPNYENSYSYYGAVAFPQYLFELTELKSLDLSWCLFDTIPIGIHALAQLETLNLAGNMLSALPDDIVELKALRTLNLSGNCLTEFPPQLEKMPWLTSVNIQGNRKESDSHLYNPLERPESTFRSMHGCSFIDGLSAWQERSYQYQLEST